MDYKNAGVDIEAGYKSVELMKEHVKENHAPGGIRRPWRFSGAFLAKNQRNRKEVGCCFSGYRRIGNQVKLAMILDKHDTIGIDAVAVMCERYRVITNWRTTSVLLDYIACGKRTIRRRSASIVKALQKAVEIITALIGN